MCHCFGLPNSVAAAVFRLSSISTSTSTTVSSNRGLRSEGQHMATSTPTSTASSPWVNFNSMKRIASIVPCWSKCCPHSFAMVGQA
uniref:Secreted protein n=1 Tax=Globodera pallida TaxID=36090 RepID=A0A183CAR1_GLOPA